MILLCRITECNPELPLKNCWAILIKINLILKLGLMNYQRIIMARPQNGIGIHFVLLWRNNCTVDRKLSTLGLFGVAFSTLVQSESASL